MLSYAEYRSRWRGEFARPTDTLYTLHVAQPLSRDLSYAFYRLGLPPNAVSMLSSALAALGIGLLLLQPGRLWVQLVVLAVLQLSYALDFADGQVARATGAASRFGRVWDLCLDRFNNAAVFLGFFLADARNQDAPPALAVLGLVLLAFMGHFLFVTANMVRFLVFTENRAVLRQWRRKPLHPLLRMAALPVEVLDTGIHYLVLSLALIGGWVGPALYLYGLLGWVGLGAMLWMLKRDPYLERLGVSEAPDRLRHGPKPMDRG